MMNTLIKPEIGTTLMRISLGIVLIFHSIYLKMMVFTLAGTAQFFDSIGLPSTLAYGVFGIEAVAGIALVLGYQTRVFTAMVIPVLLGATWAHSANGWLFTNANGGWEYPLFLTMAAVAQFFLGDGAYALSKRVKNFTVSTSVEV
ncbi:MAG: DoxX family protein [Gammaproteobacteria bacterium]|nr:DoxX family protein [Gammaproteobacteria bacterium]MDH5694554.1 DoxX family protein [Gammaproteobacteria bacterium]